MNTKNTIKKIAAVTLAALAFAFTSSAWAEELDAVQLWEGGPYFATCNVGATQPQEYGYYFWWGDTVGYTNNMSNVASQKKWLSVANGTTISFASNLSPANSARSKDVSTLKSGGWIDSNSNLVVSDDAAKNRDAARAHWGSPWRMMTYKELLKLVDTSFCTRTWTNNWNGTGINGYVVTGATAGYTDKSIFLPAAGYGQTSSFSYSGSYGRYWSSSPDSIHNTDAFGLNFELGKFNCTRVGRHYGSSVRAVRDTPPPPKYDVAIAEGITGGKVEADNAKAAENTTVTLTVTPAEYYALDTLEVCKTDDPTTKVTVTDGAFTMPAYAVTVSATFSPLGCNVTIAVSNHGKVTANRTEEIQAGDTVTLTATPDAGYALDTLTVTAKNGDAVTLDDGNAFKMPVGGVSVAAKFRFVPVVTEVIPGIFLVSSENGTVAIAGTGEAHSLVTLTPTPDEGYALGSLTVTTAGGETLKLYEGNTFYMPEESVTVTATFADTRFENKVRLEPNSTYLYTLTVPADVWNAANKEFLQTLARVYTGEGCALALSSALSGKGTLTTTPADGFSATSAMVATNGVMKTTITIKTGAVASYAAFSAVSQGAEYGEADSAKRTAAQAALKSATLAKATVTQEMVTKSGTLVVGIEDVRHGGWSTHSNSFNDGVASSQISTYCVTSEDGLYELMPNSEYTYTIIVPGGYWNLEGKGQFLQTVTRMYSDYDAKNVATIVCGASTNKQATDPIQVGYVDNKDGGVGGANGYNTGSAAGRAAGYSAEAFMTTLADGSVKTEIVLTTGDKGGRFGANFLSSGVSFTDVRFAVAEEAIAKSTLVMTPKDVLEDVAHETESSFSCGEGGKTVTTTYLTDFNVGTGRWSDTAAALADDGNCYSTDGLKALDSEIEYAQPHTITIAETENGTVTADGTGAVDARITLTVTPAENYKLDTLAVTTANGATITLDDGNAFIMPDEDITIEATFVPKAYAITGAAVADGAISVPAMGDAGSTVTLKFNTLDFVLTADTLKVTMGGEKVDLTPIDADTYTFTMPDGAVQVDATYTAIVTQPVLQTEGGEKQLTIPAEWRAAYKLRNSQVTNVTQKLDNGMTAWQSYVLGRDPTNVLSGIYADVEQDDKTDTVTIEAVGLDENTLVPGFRLTYRLEKTEEPGFLKENAVSPEFDVGIADESQDPTGHYKLSMVVTKDDVPVEGAIEAINTVGIVKQTQAATNAIISVPWSRLAPGQDAEIQVSEVVKTANLDEGDELRVYRPGSSTYESYTLDANKQWVAAKTFKVAAVGSGSQSDAPEAPAATITRGSGIWLCRKDPSKPYFLYGQSNGADDSKVEVTKGPNLIGATGTGDYYFNDHILNAEAGDIIMVPGTGDAPLRFEFKDGEWGHQKSEATTIVFKGKEYTTFRNVWSTADAKVPAGTGFWLFNNSGNITVK